jgi:hypothetical protein
MSLSLNRCSMLNDPELAQIVMSLSFASSGSNRGKRSVAIRCIPCSGTDTDAGVTVRPPAALSLALFAARPAGTASLGNQQFRSHTPLQSRAVPRVFSLVRVPTLVEPVRRWPNGWSGRSLRVAGQRSRWSVSPTVNLSKPALQTQGSSSDKNAIPNSLRRRLSLLQLM